MLADFRDVDPHMNSIQTNAILQSLSRLWEFCPETRLGQLMANLGRLAEDATARSLWEVEDEESLAVMERFREDLARRGQSHA